VFVSGSAFGVEHGERQALGRAGEVECSALPNGEPLAGLAGYGDLFLPGIGLVVPGAFPRPGTPAPVLEFDVFVRF